MTLKNITAALLTITTIALAGTAYAADKKPKPVPADKITCTHIGKLTICTKN